MHQPKSVYFQLNPPSNTIHNRLQKRQIDIRQIHVAENRNIELPIINA